MSKQQVLVIEDDAAIRRGVVDALQFAGYTTLHAGTGDEGLSLAMGAECDLLLLDLVLPGRDGFAILREVREQRPGLPVIILTAKGEEADRVRGLRMGADDYVVKPFSVSELLARVEAVLRRSPARVVAPREVPFAGGVANLTRAEISFADGRQAGLTQREVHVLRYLASQNGRCVSRQELLAHVWGIDPHGAETRTVDMQIARLRDKLDDTVPPCVLVTVRGKGYRFIAEGEDS